jgi:hypothetical protein
MRIGLAIICILYGAFGWLGQLISGLNYPMAQRLGLQEGNEGTGPLFRCAEANTARWDSVVLWTLGAAGVLMLMNHPWWPVLSLIAGAIYLDTAGRESAKYLSFYKSGIRIGTSKQMKIAKVFFASMFLVAILILAYTIWFLDARLR